MSYHEYFRSRDVAQKDYPFFSLIMAAMRKGDDKSTQKLKLMWPEVWTELFKRYHAPRGIIEGDQGYKKEGKEEEEENEV